MTTRFTEVLGREVSLRANTSDDQTWIDTFEVGYHVPPDIHPCFVLDLGANIGLTAAHYAALWPDARILAVEMDAENAAVCQKNFSGMIVQVAVGAYPGVGSYTHAGWEASYSLVRPGDTETTIMTISQILDDCLPEADQVFCKMDIEGAEWNIFSEGIDKRIKWLLVELHSDDPPDLKVIKGMGLLHDDGFAVAQHLIHPHALWATR